jgi:ribosomal protein S12 methylthiotransferase
VSKAPAQSDRGGIETIAFVSLGCPKNLVDSEKMLGTLAGRGFRLVSDHDDADAIVVNTCGFLEAAKDESLDVIRVALQRKEAGRLKRLVVAGCLVQRHRAKLLEWAPGIDAMIGVFDRDHIIDAVVGRRPADLRDDVSEVATASPPYWITGNALRAARDRGLETVGLTVQGQDGRGVGYFEGDRNRLRLTPRHFAYLRVSEGCNQKCSFCTIPSIRGKMRSKPLDAIVDEARALMIDGAFELNLIGQDTTSYGYDIYGRHGAEGEVRAFGAYAGDLVGLLTALNDVAADFGTGWIRLMYAYPTNFTSEMIDAIAALPNVVKYIDMPLQHVSNRMLERMRRKITRQRQEDLLYELRERIPGLAIRTTFITGFPGETEADHRELVEFIEEFQFDMLGVFRYSREAGTSAGTMDEDPDLHVPDEVKARREEELMHAQQAIAFENAEYVAEQCCQFDVLIDGPVDETSSGAWTTAAPSGEERHVYVGRCYHQAPQVDSVTYVSSAANIAAGELVRCTIVGANGYDLIAQPTEQLERTISLPVMP